MLKNYLANLDIWSGVQGQALNYEGSTKLLKQLLSMLSLFSLS